MQDGRQHGVLGPDVPTIGRRASWHGDEAVERRAVRQGHHAFRCPIDGQIAPGGEHDEADGVLLAFSGAFFQVRRVAPDAGDIDAQRAALSVAFDHVLYRYIEMFEAVAFPPS